MQLFVALRTQGSQIVCLVVSKHAARFHVVDVQIVRRTAELATPTVSFEHLIPKCLVLRRAELQSRLFCGKLLITFVGSYVSDLIEFL